jgi:hypothetical protein
MTKCPECGSFATHAYWCKTAAPEEHVAALEATVRCLLECNRRQHRALNARRNNAELWHGKWAIVKHENNVLRRKLKRQGAE